MDSDRFYESATIFDEAIKIDPKNQDALNGKGISLLMWANIVKR